MYKRRLRKRILLSQNFIKDKNLVQDLLKRTSLNKKDTVLEIGSGDGIITSELIKVARQVIAIELDINLYQKTSQKFADVENLKLVYGNILNFELPQDSYKVFSNIPFNMTTSIISKLLKSKKPPEDLYLIVQKEAALRFIGLPFGNGTQISIVFRPWFSFNILYEFNRSDFYPHPNVDIVLLHIHKLSQPYLHSYQKKLFRDVVTYCFNVWKPNLREALKLIIPLKEISAFRAQYKVNLERKPSEITFEEWLKIFELFNLHMEPQNFTLIYCAGRKLDENQSKIRKVHRTRNDLNWKYKTLGCKT